MVREEDFNLGEENTNIYKVESHDSSFRIIKKEMNDILFQKIKNLKDEKDPPKHILMHVDLKSLIRTLGHRAASENDKRKIKSITKFPTPHEDRVNPMVCDLLVSSFLKHQFFSRFDAIVINTVYTDCDKNYVQKMKRDRPNEKIKSNKKHIKNN